MAQKNKSPDPQESKSSITIKASAPVEEEIAYAPAKEMTGDALKYSFQTLTALEYYFNDPAKRERYIKDGVEQDHYDGKCAIQGNIEFTISAAEEVLLKFNKKRIISELKQKLDIKNSESDRAFISDIKSKILRKEIAEQDLNKDELALVNARQDQYPGLRKNPFSKNNNYIKDLKLLNHNRFNNFLDHYHLLEYARADAQADIIVVKRLEKQLAAYRSSLENKPWKSENGSPRFMRAQAEKNDLKKEHLRILQEDLVELSKIIAQRKNTYRIRSNDYLKWLETVGEAEGFISREEQESLAALKKEVKSYRHDTARQLISEKNIQSESNDPQEIFSKLKEIMEDEIDRAHDILSNEIRKASLGLAFLDVQEDRGMLNTDVASEESENLQTSVHNMNVQKTFLKKLVYAYKVMCIQEQPLLFTETYNVSPVAGVEYKGVLVPALDA